jgi:hypothetical protein
MDPATIAVAVVSLVGPFLKGFLTGAKGAAEEMGEEAGGKLKELAASIWAKLHPKLKDKPAAIEAAQDVANDPKDEDAVASLRYQLRKILEQDSVLTEEFGSVLTQAQRAGVIADTYITGGVHASGDHSIAIGKARDVHTGVPREPPK